MKKNSSKNLGDSMRRGLTKSTQQTSSLEKGKDDTASSAKETRIGAELTELDTASFESVLQDAIDHPVWDKNRAKALDHKLVNPVIMGLIDGAKQRNAADKDSSDTAANTKAPVKFDDVIDFIDDGVEEIVVGKPTNLTANMLNRSPNIKSPIRGNPVTDFDKMHEMNGNGENSAPFNQDAVSLMEMGHHKMDSSDERKLKDGQKNIKCDEKEQLDYMREKGLNDYAKFDTVLGPASQGEFSSFAQNLTPVISSELGVLNPVNTNAYNVFQTCTTNGRLLPAIPRKFFSTTDNHPRPTHRPSPSKPPVTIMLQTAAPSFLNTSVFTDSTGIYSSAISGPTGGDATGESANSKKKQKKAAKKAAAKAAEEKNSVDSDFDDEDEKENENEEGLTEKERDARRRRNNKNRERKKAKKQEEKKEKNEKSVEVPEESVNSAKAAETQAETPAPDVVATASPEESPKAQQNTGRRTNVPGAGGKNKKNDKSVSAEYTVGSNGVGSHSLEDILKEFGIDVSETTEKPTKKNKKGANNNTSKKASKQQKKDQAAKETARSPPSDNELSLDDDAEKGKKQGKKKMDEVAVAASITKRSSSGVGQSEEDDDQSYVSAQENLGGSTSRLSTPPIQAEFVDARQSRDDYSENVMLDPNNYRDDEDVDSLALQLQQQEDEFITVGKNKKKNKKAAVQEIVPASSTGSSSSPPNRRNSTAAPAASAVSPSGNNSSQQHHQHSRNNNRPVAHSTTLGDFMESTKKDTHKNIKHKKVVSPINTSVQKKQISMEEPTPSSPAFVDALETPISVNTAPTFSYADAAKKSSGENTPAHEMSPVPQSAKSPAETETKKVQEAPSVYAPPKYVATSKSSAVQLPAASAAVADADISFGYEETLDEKRRHMKKETVEPTPELPVGRTSATALLKHFAKNGKDALQEMPKNGASESNVLANEIVLQWNARWKSFNSGSKPVVFKSLHKK